MKILIVHCPYQQRGGEDSVVDDEIRLLRAGGHDVTTLLIPNDAIAGFRARVRTALEVADAAAGRDLVPEAVARLRPDIVHVHNFFPLVSPAVHGRVRALGPATVQTLHNYRVTCAAGVLLREGRTCELCIEGSPYNAVRHRCYRGSVVGSTVVAHMIAKHRRVGTWRSDVDRFIALSAFARDIFVRAGLPAERIAIRPNAVEDPGAPYAGKRSGFLYAGRLSGEKGIRVLLAAARLTDTPITVIGDGPLGPELFADAPSNVTFLGRQPREAVRDAMARAAAVVVPSLSYEGFPVTVAESLAAGTPVIASRIGSVAEIVAGGSTGWLVPPDDPTALAAAIAGAARDEAEARRRGDTARQVYLEHYTPQNSLAALEAIYADAIAARRSEDARPAVRPRTMEVSHVA